MKNTVVVVLRVGSVGEVNDLDLHRTIDDPLKVTQCGAVQAVLATERVIRLFRDLRSWIDILSNVLQRGFGRALPDISTFRVKSRLPYSIIFDYLSVLEILN